MKEKNQNKEQNTNQNQEQSNLLLQRLPASQSMKQLVKLV